MTATLIGVGVGPGDPEHLTVRAIRTLREADIVVAPSVSADTEGRAEGIVRQAVPDIGIRRIPFEMAPGAPARAATARVAAETINTWFDQHPRVAFVTLGDPNVYSTFSAIAAEVHALRPEVEIETVPGIMAFQDLASRSNTVLLDDVQSLALVTALDGPDAAIDALADPCRAVIVYKGGRHVGAIARGLAAAGRLDGAVMGELLGLPGERIAPMADVTAGSVSYLATIVVPPKAPVVDRNVIGS